MEDYDFSGWATRNNIKCSDGRTIMKDAFKCNDGVKVPLVWNHQHNGPDNVLGHALLENRDEGVYAYGKFNETENGQYAKELVRHGDIKALSIYANHLKQEGGNVCHGNIREVSLVLAGANPGAYIDYAVRHGDNSEENEAEIFLAGEFELEHADAETTEEVVEETATEEVVEEKTTEVVEEVVTEETVEEVTHSDESNNGEKTVEDVINGMSKKKKEVLYRLVAEALLYKGESEAAEHSEETEETEEVVEETDGEETYQDIINTMTEEEQAVLFTLVDEALKQSDESEEDLKEENYQGGNDTMKHNVFDKEQETNNNVLTHADQTEIIKMAKQTSCGSFKEAVKMYAEQNNKDLAHAFSGETIESLFPEYQYVKPGAPEVIKKDLGWVDVVMNGVHKSPISRVRTRQANAKEANLRALGYKKENEKQYAGVVGLLNRHTDPQTIYIKDKLNRDDIIDITDFDVVEYQYGFMKDALNEEIATAIMVGDGREDGAEDKIYETHVRSIWNDEELYTIHADVNYEEMAAELQGSNTAANFGENYIWAEAMVQSALYARENYKGSGNLVFFCTPHFVNVMLLARDLNGRRIYNSKADLEAALNVKAICTAEQFEGKTRTTKDGKVKKLIGLFVNLSDYQVGATKGGEITRFEDFDIDFNQYKYLIETRMSGALTKIKSAIALEEDVTESN